jgi:hypothetical protein
MSSLEALHARAKALQLHGSVDALGGRHRRRMGRGLLAQEEQERARRSMERRLSSAHIGRFKPACDFGWTWPKRDALMFLDFLKEATNVILVDQVGKSTLARNIAHQALIHGRTKACSCKAQF